MHKGRAYKETEDQEAMTRLVDLDLAKANSRSFRRLYHAVEEAVGLIDTGEIRVTPHFPVAPEAVEPSKTAPKQSGRKKDKS